MKEITPVKQRVFGAKRRRGIALITVVSVLALMTLLTVAMFSVSQTELASSNQQTYQERSRELADSAVNVVMDQVWQATKRKDEGAANGRRYLWSSQPGAVRRYTTEGAFDSGYKLYSSSQMVVRGSERAMVDDKPPVSWNTTPNRYVDLNEPVIRPASDGAGTPHLYFPILDPRAYVRSQEGVPNNNNVEGFYYSAGVNGVVDPLSSTAATSLDARLPMPVEWVYVLKDGTFGVLDSANRFIKPDGSLLSDVEGRANPISGRVAFWTDDESCKLNINTASEPTYWTVPSLFHDRDLWWAYYQPTSHEFQRYPGHPATVALSTVFFPNQPMDLYGRSGTDPTYREILQRKETIYKLTPKINFGGSKAGTIPYWKFVDNYTGTGGTYKDSSLYNKYLSLVDSIQERLYASVDELYFADGFENGRRKLSSYVNGSNGAATADPFFVQPGQSVEGKVNLERLRFFLTAQSRMPETNLFGLPRIAAWPVADEGGLEYEAGKPVVGVTNPKDFRTGFDQLIAFCSSMGKTGNSGEDSYFFRRKCAYSPTRDIELARNKALIGYLFNLMEQKFPGGASFKDKYPQDYKQILVEIFDYVRATNLYDGFLAPSKEDLQKAGGLYDRDKYVTATGMGPTGLAESTYDGFVYAERPKTFKTFTYDRSSYGASRGATGQSYTERLVETSFPGHGMVAPSLYKDGTDTYVGFGRFVALSEVGFQFICTADGATDKGSYVNPVADGANWKEPAVGAPDRKVSGGRTALKIERYIPKDATKEEAGAAVPKEEMDPWYKTMKKQFWYSNYPPRPTVDTMQNHYGVDTNLDDQKPNSVYNHPGCKPENWNVTLESGAPPLGPTERRVQGMLVMKFSMPAPGFSLMNPEFTVKVEGLKNMQLAGMDLYDRVGAAEFEWKSNHEFFGAQDSRPFGGAASSYAMTFNRRVGSKTLGVTADTKYASAGGSRSTGVAPAPHFGTRNLDITTKFLTVPVVDGSGNEGMMDFSGGRLTIKIYSSHNAKVEDLVQTVNVEIPRTSVPVPQLVTVSTDYKQFLSGGTLYKQEAIHAPRWWAFNYCGALRRLTGFWDNSRKRWTVTSRVDDKNTSYTTDFITNGRLFVPTTSSTPATYAPVGLDGVPRWASTLWAFDPSSGFFSNALLNPSSPAADVATDCMSETKYSDTQPENGAVRDSRGQDTVFTMVASHGDSRLLAAKTEVTTSDWVPHPRTANLGKIGTGPGNVGTYKQYVAHSLSRYYSDREPGYDRGTTSTRLVPGANYGVARIPDLPTNASATDLAARYGDFDNGISDLRDGPYINKPDEGNTHISFRITNDSASTIRMPLAYMGTWTYGELSSASGESFMSPNRMMPSPGMFGSLPTGVRAGDPWRTLLFRPNVVTANGAPGDPMKHPGAAAWQGGVSPADHYIMDLFWMPVVEPYAVSEPFSTAGKVNINYQIVPFHYIRRATGLHALLKGEMLKAVPTADAPNYLSVPTASKFVATSDGYTYKQPWTDQEGRLSETGQATKKYWHREIEAEKRGASGEIVGGVLKQFEDRFAMLPTTPAATRGLFRTASQICEIHLIPKKLAGASGEVELTGGDGTADAQTPAYNVSDMEEFWKKRRLTGDNTRERPYANIYGKITTQSNTFRVHYRAQVIRKARSSTPTEFDANRDNVLTDFRGSTVIERRIDPADSRIPDYGASDNPLELPSLEEFYRFRVLEVKRFMP